MMNEDTELIVSLLAKATPEERAAYNRTATAHNRKLYRQAELDLGEVAYQLGQARNLLECMTDYFDDTDDGLLKYHENPSPTNAILVAAFLEMRFERWKTLIFAARDGVNTQIKLLEGGE